MDFSKTEDIIFLAVTAAIGLALLAATVVVIVKGRRVTRVPDILLRVFAIVFAVASAALVVAAVFTRLDGGVRIDFSDGAVLIAGNDSVTLPMTELFVILSTVLGLVLSASVFALSLAALIVDCVLARKEKKRAVKKVMTPEEAKRAAEINRIRALANSALSKSNSASALVNDKKRKDDGKTAEAEKAPKEQPEETQKPLSPEELAKGDIEEPDWMKKPDTDWRTSEDKSTSFVGIGNSDDEPFDDPFADTFDEENADAGENSGSEIYDDGSEEDFGGGDEFDAEENIGDADGGKFDSEKFDGDVETDTVDAEDDMYFGDENEYVDYGGEVNRDIYIPKIRTIQRNPSNEVESKPSKVEKEQTSGKKQPSKSDKKVAAEKKPVEAKKQSKAKAQSGSVAEPAAQKGKKTGDKVSKRTPASSASKVKADKAAAEPEFTAPVKPAPKKNVSQKDPAPKKTDDKPARRSSRTPATSASVIRAAKDPEKLEKPEQAEVKKKTKASEKTSGVPAKDKDEKAAPAKDALTIERPSDDRRLPVNKRYIILDRKSAVNMFNEYLKERDRADKDKLESNINTIILK